MSVAPRSVPDQVVPSLRGMTGCDSVDYYIESPIDNNGRLDLFNTSCRDIQIQIIQIEIRPLLKRPES